MDNGLSIALGAIIGAAGTILGSVIAQLLTHWSVRSQRSADARERVYTHLERVEELLVAFAKDPASAEARDAALLEIGKLDLRVAAKDEPIADFAVVCLAAIDEKDAQEGWRIAMDFFTAAGKWKRKELSPTELKKMTKIARSDLKRPKETEETGH